MSSWHVPRMWEGERCFILGGSPCLLDEDLELIHDERIIGVNNSYELGDWVDICWFGDERWLEWNREKLSEFKGLKMCCVESLAKDLERKEIKALHRGKPQGIERRSDHVSWNNNSGFSAINLAVHLGVKTIILLGFAMKVGKDKEHNWHNHHLIKGHDPIPYFKFLDSLPVIKKDAKELGITIINSTMDSDIEERFIPRMPLEEVVNEKNLIGV